MRVSNTMRTIYDDNSIKKVDGLIDTLPSKEEVLESKSKKETKSKKESKSKKETKSKTQIYNKV